jgi:peptidoglycan hydrolase CwlO-like protein
VVILASAAAVPASAAAPAQPPPAGAGGATTGVTTADEALRGDSTGVAGSLDEVRAEVADHVDALQAAQAAVDEADGAVDDAGAAVRATEERIAELTDETDQVVVEAFINPPTETAMETLATGSVVGSTVRQSFLDSQADENAELLASLEEARAELADRQRAAEEAVDEAEARAAEADVALADLIEAQSSETLFVMAVQERLAANRAEAASLAEIDPAAAAALRAREGEIAGLIDEIIAEREERARLEALAEAMAAAAAKAEADAAAARRSSGPSTSSGGSAPATPSTITSVSGGLASVSCPGGGSITVAGSIAGSLRAMLDAAAAAGNRMCGNGYRDPADQVAVRRSNCGTSYYAIYEAPASACSPPTAPPGTSAHEQGLAVDLTCNGGGVLSSSSSCYSWLTGNAAGYGFYNLPGEPWHWSTDGT